MYKVKYTKQFQKWLEGLNNIQRKSIEKLIVKLEIFGYMLTTDDSKQVKGSKCKLRELRCKKFGNRAYYFFYGNEIYICLNGGDKTTQKRDIKQAESIAKDIIQGGCEND
ncbi:type II toxin-antitoxin system RelE/ParE family toxin [Allofrancisella guangzhouensis]|uniref:type II toxin-antitoxin system RelE/ParE family toxin n=1 Tax=Allofrancisella guangzhouensis TaxID=594679 RepID=UPI001907BB0B|nr:type II toxin-antitoxin system RelE/ParE family toxin [Allofrancisella guangzhouensis]MBK2027409.1 type II toxin-antitoxin system RelE/ParE family toxin [Allofrancisella guangzhouensis]